MKSLFTEVNCNLGTLSFYRLLPVLVPLLVEPSYVIKLHAERRPLADVLITLGVIQPTYIYRDPRDALLSAYEYGQRMLKKGLENAFTPLSTIEKSIQFMDFYVKVAKGWLSSNQTLAVKYEDLKLDYDQEITRLTKFLKVNLADKEIQEVVERYRPNQTITNQQGLHFVKGEIGRYQEVFTDSQLTECDKLFGDFLRDYGYSE